MRSTVRREVPRRRVLAALATAPVVLGLLGGCALLGEDTSDGPDPLIALAAAARADAAMAAAVLAGDPALTDRVEPLRAARVEHAAALDAEIARLAPDAAPATPAPAPVPAPATLAELRTALLGSREVAGAAALDLPAERVGLVASISACCAAYATVLT